MQFDRLTLDQDRLKCLDAQSVQCRCTVQHDGMLFDNVLEDIPDARLQTLDHLLCRLDVVRGTVLYKLLHNERLEQLDRHLFRQAALIDLQFGSDDDNGTA